MKKHGLLILILAGVALAADAPLPMPTAERLPRWRGFNLLEKFYKGNDKPFLEQDFQLISQLGFNFVRLPMDYRVWIVDGDWNRFNEPVLQEIDQAVNWGRRYGIHVCLNFHRAPGYTVAKPPEPRSLWTDAEAQRVCAAHWAMFARRYRGISNRYLSFNLMNEPANVKSGVYAAVARQLVRAIRAEDPNRLIISDGLEWGKTPCRELFDLGVAQATRGYQPFTLTHYRASWVNSQGWPEPRWPTALGWAGYLYGSYKQDLHQPATIDLVLPRPATLHLRLGQVSSLATLVISRSGQADPLFQRQFKPGPGDGPWKQSTHHPQWNSYSAVYDLDLAVPLPTGTYRLSLANTIGDWITLTRAELEYDGHRYAIDLRPQWGAKPFPVRFDAGAAEPRLEYPRSNAAEQLWNDYVRPWARLQAEQHIGAMVGEWGAYNKTSHEVTLRWMEDCLKHYRRANLGWALWNFRGPFGILDSDRADVRYEPFHGHQLDRKMLQLLQRY